MTTILKGMGFEPWACCTTTSHSHSLMQRCCPCEYEDCCTELCVDVAPDTVEALLQSGWKRVPNAPWQLYSAAEDPSRQITLEKTCHSFEGFLACPAQAACSIGRPITYGATFLPVGACTILGSVCLDFYGCLASLTPLAPGMSVNSDEQNPPSWGRSKYTKVPMRDDAQQISDMLHSKANDARKLNGEYYRCMNPLSCSVGWPKVKFKYLTLAPPTTICDPS